MKRNLVKHTSWIAVLLLAAPQMLVAQVGQPPGGNQPVSRQVNATNGPIEVDPRVDELLTSWCNHSKQINSFYVEFTKKTFDPLAKAEERERSSPGSARFLRMPSSERELFRMDIKRDESWVINDEDEIWHYDSKSNHVVLYKIAPNQEEKIDPLPLFMCRNPNEAKRNYHFKIQGEDKKNSLVHIIVIPRTKQLQSDFERAEIILDTTTFVPKQLYFREPTRLENTLEFTRIDLNNNNIQVADFETKEKLKLLKSKGWTFDQRDPPSARGNQLGQNPKPAPNRKG